jgi:hypothetical protein
VKGLLTDVNIERHFHLLVRLLEQEPWTEFWAHLNLRALEFHDLGLASDATDLNVWQTCQREELALLTANRNLRGGDSLEAAIRTLNTPRSLPVFTLGDADRILHDRVYADRVVDRLIDYLLDIDRYRGTGRLYLP